MTAWMLVVLAVLLAVAAILHAGIGVLEARLARRVLALYRRTEALRRRADEVRAHAAALGITHAGLPGIKDGLTDRGDVVDRFVMVGFNVVCVVIYGGGSVYLVVGLLVRGVA